MSIYYSTILSKQLSHQSHPMLILPSPVTFLPSGGFTHPCYRAGPTTHIFYPTSGPPVLRSSKSKAVELIVFPFLFSLEAGAQACGMQRSSVRDPKRRQRVRSSGSALPEKSGGNPPPGELGDGGGELLQGAAVGELPPPAAARSPEWSNFGCFLICLFMQKFFHKIFVKVFFILRKKFFTKHSAKVFSYYLAAKVSLSTFL